MSPSRSQAGEGLRSEALQAALAAALAGNVAPLEDLLCRYGGGADPRPNFRLAAAFGAEAEARSAVVTRVLARFTAEDAAPDTPRVFLPIAAAHGWVGRLRAGADAAQAWHSLGVLAADERAPVRLGTLDALAPFVLRRGGADALLAHAEGWLDDEDREVSFGSAALVTEVFASRQALGAVGDSRAALAYLSRAIEAVAGAPRSAERSDARRRLLQALPRTIAAAVVAFAGGDRGPAWLEDECGRASHPDVRAALSESLQKLRAQSEGASALLVERLRAALQASAKPPRDPTRKRPGSDRGRASRRVK
jgi:hypothetical protein